MNYDANILRQFATELYERAEAIIQTYIILYAGAGLLLLGFVGNYLERGSTGSFIGTSIGGVIGMFTGVVIGQYIGTNKTFLLKVRTQEILCQAQIEENTRA
jgi:hypothetical protein